MPNIGPVTQSDVPLTADQEVAGLITTGSGNIFVETDHEIFSSHSLPSADSRRAVVNFW